MFKPQQWSCLVLLMRMKVKVHFFQSSLLPVVRVKPPLNDNGITNQDEENLRVKQNTQKNNKTII